MVAASDMAGPSDASKSWANMLDAVQPLHRHSNFTRSLLIVVNGSALVQT